MFECTTSIEHCKGMLFCNKFQTFGQLFSYFNVLLTLSPYYKKQRHRKAFTFRCLYACLNVFHQNIPNSDDVADATSQNKEMEHGMHVFLLVDAVEYGSRNVAHALGDDPSHRGGRYGIYQWLESHEHRQSHAHKAGGLQVAVVLEPGKTHDGSGDGARPDKDEEAPSPVALVAQRNQGDRGVGTRNVPVDGGVVPLSQSLLPLAPCRDGVINRGCDVRHQHTE